MRAGVETGPAGRIPSPGARLATGLVVLAALAAPAGAQIRASELASISQMIDGTKISLEYSRPRARGREDMFGGEVKWKEVWTPGANMATTLELSKDVRIEGHAVPKGKYSMWMVVRPDGDWTLVLDPRVKLFHMAHPDSTAEQIRFPVKAVSGPFTEVLAFTFPENRATGATLEMSWGRTRVPMQITVQPTLRVATPADVAAPYLGRYEYRWGDMPDSLKSLELVVTYADSTLRMHYLPKDPYMDGASLIRIKDDWYIPGLYQKGVLYETIPEMVFEFKVVGGKAVSFEVRGDKDEIWATGKRKG
jgi:hypothetical protein